MKISERIEAKKTKMSQRIKETVSPSEDEKAIVDCYIQTTGKLCQTNNF